MVGIGRALIVLQVAGHTTGIGQGVVSVYVALRALQREVRTGQRETCGRVIECGIRPGRRAMAAFTSLRHSSLHVVGIGRSLKVLQVARDARGVGQVVISVDMTLRALQRDVRPGQRETRLAMIESGVRPRCRRVATLAGLRHARLHVIRVGGSLVVLEVAKHASGDSKVEVAVDVTLCARRGEVYSSQREAGLAVIEGGIGP